MMQHVSPCFFDLITYFEQLPEFHLVMDLSVGIPVVFIF